MGLGECLGYHPRYSPPRWCAALSLSLCHADYNIYSVPCPPRRHPVPIVTSNLLRGFTPIYEPSAEGDEGYDQAARVAAAGQYQRSDSVFNGNTPHVSNPLGTHGLIVASDCIFQASSPSCIKFQVFSFYVIFL